MKKVDGRGEEVTEGDGEVASVGKAVERGWNGKRKRVG